MSTEGGHADWSPKTQEDFDLQEFAKNYIETSNNVENKRAKGKVYRISIERLCAGPALPLIYEFMKSRHPKLATVIEKETKADDITGEMINKCAMKLNDPLCMKTVQKLVDIYATEVGNFALKTLPYGGIYLVGGVTMGISKYLI